MGVMEFVFFEGVFYVVVNLLVGVVDKDLKMCFF